MNRIVLDDDLKSKLNGMNETVEVRSADGSVVGQFVPQSKYIEFMYAIARIAVTDEELDEAEKESGAEPLGDLVERAMEKRLGAA